MEGKSTLINAAITLVLMATLAIIAFIFKMRGNETGGMPEATAVEQEVEELHGSDGVTGTSGHLYGNDFPSVLPDCVLVDSQANDGDSFRVRYSGQERVFDLYLADAPEVSLSYDAQLARQGEYYNGVDRDTVIRIGDEAKAFALDILKTCKFTVFTSWEQVSGTPRFYAFIVVEHRPGKRCFLSELLVLRGFAKPSDRPVTMPAGVADFESFRKTMASYEQRARREKNGGWGIIAGKMPVRRAAVVPASG